MSLYELFGPGYDYQCRYIDKIMSVSREGIIKAVGTIIKPYNYVLVTVGSMIENRK